MHSVLSLSMGYVLGSVSPAKLVSSRRHVDLDHSGTGNLGATNTFLVLGKAAAVVVMLFDIFKAWLAMRLAGIFFPMTRLAPLSAGLGAMLGHDYSLFLKFRGGKGPCGLWGHSAGLRPQGFRRPAEPGHFDDADLQLRRGGHGVRGPGLPRGGLV